MGAAAHGRRIQLLDELRGLSILLMVVHHFLYSLGFLFHVPLGEEWFVRLAVLTPVFAGLFMALCGLSCRLSRSNLRRGLLLAGIACGITAVLWFFLRDEVIWFGILHFLATGILLFALLRPLLDKIPPAAGIGVNLLLFALLYHLPYEKGGWIGPVQAWSLPVPLSLAQYPWLLPFGFSTDPGTDYFPLLPWIFLFFAGTFLGVYAAQGRFPAWTCRRHCPPLAFIGRHTLWIYVLHQPVICGLLWLWFRLFG